MSGTGLFAGGGRSSITAFKKPAPGPARASSGTTQAKGLSNTLVITPQGIKGGCKENNTGNCTCIVIGSDSLNAKNSAIAKGSCRGGAAALFSKEGQREGDIHFKVTEPVKGSGSAATAGVHSTVNGSKAHFVVAVVFYVLLLFLAILFLAWILRAVFGNL